MPAKTVEVVEKKPSKEPAKAAKESPSYYIPITSLPSLQELIGGIPRGTILAALGAPGSCKTTLFTQLSCEVAKAEKGNVLVFDTENSFHSYLELAGGLSSLLDLDLNVVRVRGNIVKSGNAKEPKYEVDWEYEDEVDPKATNIFVVHCPDITPLSVMWGRGVELKIYESGKFKVMMMPGAFAASIEDSPIAQFFVKNKCRTILIDSITNPLDELPAVGENFPARADLTQTWMIQIHKMAAFYNIPVFATFHESKNDTNPFSKQLKVEGGKGVGYNLKFILYMLRENEMGLLPKAAVKPKTLPSDERAIFVVRHGSTRVRPWKQIKYVTISDKGLLDGEAGSTADASEDEDESDN